MDRGRRGRNGFSWKSHENRLGRCGMRHGPQGKGTVTLWLSLGLSDDYLRSMLANGPHCECSKPAKQNDIWESSDVLRVTLEHFSSLTLLLDYLKHCLGHKSMRGNTPSHTYTDRAGWLQRLLSQASVDKLTKGC